MSIEHGFSRRDVLAMSVAAGGIAMGGSIRGASAQVTKRIEQLAPELDKIIATTAPINDLADGFGGPLGPAEGPLWWKEGGYLLFSPVQGVRECGGRKHREFTRDGKNQLLKFVQANATLEDIMELVKLIRALRDYLRIKVNHILC
jgi:hypothetical protein